MNALEAAEAKLKRELKDCAERAAEAVRVIPDYAKVIHKAQPVGSTKLEFSG